MCEVEFWEVFFTNERTRVFKEWLPYIHSLAAE